MTISLSSSDPFSSSYRFSIHDTASFTANMLLSNREEHPRFLRTELCLSGRVSYNTNILTVSVSHLCVCLSVCLSVSQSVCLCVSVCLSVNLSVCLSVSQSVSVCVSVYLSVNQSFWLCVLSVSQSVCVCLYVCQSISLSICLSVCLSCCTIFSV